MVINLKKQNEMLSIGFRVKLELVLKDMLESTRTSQKVTANQGTLLLQICMRRIERESSFPFIFNWLPPLICECF